MTRRFGLVALAVVGAGLGCADNRDGSGGGHERGTTAPESEEDAAHRLGESVQDMRYYGGAEFVERCGLPPVGLDDEALECVRDYERVATNGLGRGQIRSVTSSCVEVQKVVHGSAGRYDRRAALFTRDDCWYFGCSVRVEIEPDPLTSETETRVEEHEYFPTVRLDAQRRPRLVCPPTGMRF